MNARRLKLLACAVASTVITAGCGGAPARSEAVSGNWNDVVAAAEDEGSVLLYSSHNPKNLEALKKAFESEHPNITMEFVRGTDADLNPKVEVENQTGRGAADVHMLTDAAWIERGTESGTYSTTVRGPAFEEAEYSPETSIIGDTFFLTSAAVFALGWNTDRLPKGLDDPRDILDPSLKGKIGITNPAGIAAYIDFYRFMEKNFGDDYLDELAKLQPRVYPSSLGIAQALASGEIVASPVVQPLVSEVESGAPVDWALPTPPWGAPWYSHVLSAAPHPNAAQVLANFMVTRAGQEALSTGYASAIPDVEGSVAVAQDVKLPDASTLTPEANEKYQAEWEKLFTS